MLGVILGILKVIGILICMVLLLLFIVAGILLFVPVRYRIEGRKTEQDLCGKANISFLLHFVKVEAFFQKNKMQFQIKILGRTIEQWKKTAEKLKRRKKKKIQKKKIQNEERREKKIEKIPDIKGEEKIQRQEKAKEDKKEEAVLPKENIQDKTIRKEMPHKGEEERNTIEKMQEKETEEEASHKKEQGKSFSEKISDFLELVRNKIFSFKKQSASSVKTIKRRWQAIRRNTKNVTEKIRYYYDLCREETTKEVFYFCRRQILWILKKIAPKKMIGYVRFGTGDPAMTGEVMGVISIVLPVYSYEVELEPDFEQKVFEGELKAEGSIQGWNFAVLACRFLRNKNFWKVIRKIRA